MNRHSKSKADSSLCESMFVGMDVHKSYLQIAVLDEHGKVVNNSRVDNNLRKIAKFFDRLDHDRKNTKIVMESSGM